MNAVRAAALGVLLATLLAPLAHAGGARDSLDAPPPLLSRRDAAFALGAAAVVGIVATQDASWSRAASAHDTPGARDAARAAKQLGNHLLVAPALLAVDAAARATHHPALGAATERVAFACACAGVTTLALKQAAGRLRPNETSETHRFEPFSGHDSFPSGHTTMAISLAAALDAETRTPWVPVLMYPAAALTAWSRVHDRVHWPSDVAAGAAIGGWVAYRADQWAQSRWPDGLWVLVVPQHGGASARATLRF